VSFFLAAQGSSPDITMIASASEIRGYFASLEDDGEKQTTAKASATATTEADPYGMTNKKTTNES
jgi:hypothetical protein